VLRVRGNECTITPFRNSKNFPQIALLTQHRLGGACEQEAKLSAEDIGGEFMSSTSLGAIAKESVGWSIGLSVLMILAGVLAIAVPPAAGLAVVIVVAWLLIFSGVAHFVFAWYTRTTGGFVWELLLGILYFLVGVYTLRNPAAGLASLTLVLAIYLFAEGLLEFILSFRLRPMPGSNWLLFDGIITLILAILIWRSWPSSSEWVLGTLVGISMLFSGVSRLALSLAARSVVGKLA
jgi:uncharacterized membrane protein HdeD (DUF308 family)